MYRHVHAHFAYPRQNVVNGEKGPPCHYQLLIGSTGKTVKSEVEESQRTRVARSGADQFQAKLFKYKDKEAKGN